MAGLTGMMNKKGQETQSGVEENSDQERNRQEDSQLENMRNEQDRKYSWSQKKYLGNAKGGYSNIRSKSPEEQGKEVQEVLSVESNGG